MTVEKRAETDALDNPLNMDMHTDQIAHGRRPVILPVRKAHSCSRPLPLRQPLLPRPKLLRLLRRSRSLLLVQGRS